jgi:hypothetical protein
LKALWGNTIPISFAAIADIQGKDYRRSFALASSTYSLAFITLIIIGFFSKRNDINLFISSGILIISIISCIYIFNPAPYKTIHLSKEVDFYHSKKIFSKLWKLGIREIGLLLEELKRPLTKYGLSAYILWETSMYSIIISQIDLNRGSSQNITLAMMIGYLIGVFALQIRPCNMISDRKMITVGYIFSCLSFLPYFSLRPFVHSQYLLIGICYTLHALGNAFLSPTILSILAKQRSVHERGKILGLVESADTIAFLLASIFVMLHKNYDWPVAILVIFSLTSFLISWIYFPIIKNLEKNIYKSDKIA